MSSEKAQVALLWELIGLQVVKTVPWGFAQQIMTDQYSVS